MTDIIEVIEARIKKAKAKWRASDNISDFIQEEELPLIEEALVKVYEAERRTLLINPEDPNSAETPRRKAKMYMREIMRGRYQPQPEIRAFPNDGEDSVHDLQVIEVVIKSMCSHHHQPVNGVAYIGALPGDSMMGLSKFSRIADWMARRGTLQEELGRDIAVACAEFSETEHVAVAIYAKHGCICNRGVNSARSLFSTQSLLGDFKTDAPLRKEFMDHVRNMMAIDGF